MKLELSKLTKTESLTENYYYYYKFHSYFNAYVNACIEVYSLSKNLKSVGL